MIVAVLARHARVALGGADVFVNVAGGVRIDEPGADLGDRARDRLGRAGRAGQGRARRVRRGRPHRARLRAATQAERRLEECAKLGLRRVLAPKGTPGHGRRARRGRDRRAGARRSGSKATAGATRRL